MNNQFSEKINAYFGRGTGRASGWAGAGDWSDDGAYRPTPGLAQSFMRHLTNSWEMNQVTDEVLGEQRGSIALVSADPALSGALMAGMRQQPVPEIEEGSIQREGLFTLITLPLSGRQAALHPDAERWTAQSVQNGTQFTDSVGYEPAHDSTYRSEWDGWPPMAEGPETLLATADGADIILYLFSAETGWYPEDSRWFHRLRAGSTPVLVVALHGPGYQRNSVHGHKFRRVIQRHLGNCLLFVELPTVGDGELNGGLNRNVWPEGPQDAERSADQNRIAVAEAGPLSSTDLCRLTDLILAMRPRLAIPLAQEVPSSRPQVLRKIVHSGMWMTAVLGAEPIPFLDLPLHVAMHWRVAMQIASIYGRPGLDYRSREMMITVGLNLFMRYLAQQGVKLVPVMGWGLSAIISGSSTWLLGRALVHYYEEGEAIMNQVADKAANQAFGKIKASISWKKTSKESSHEMEPNARIDRFAVEE